MTLAVLGLSRGRRLCAKLTWSDLEAQQPLQVFPQDELFLLLGQALQAHDPGHRPTLGLSRASSRSEGRAEAVGVGCRPLLGDSFVCASCPEAGESGKQRNA